MRNAEVSLYAYSQVRKVLKTLLWDLKFLIFWLKWASFLVRVLNIQVPDALGVGLDEGFAGRDFTPPHPALYSLSYCISFLYQSITTTAERGGTTIPFFVEFQAVLSTSR